MHSSQALKIFLQKGTCPFLLELFSRARLDRQEQKPTSTNQYLIAKRCTHQILQILCCQFEGRPCSSKLLPLLVWLALEPPVRFWQLQPGDDDNCWLWRLLPKIHRGLHFGVNPDDCQRDLVTSLSHPDFLHHGFSISSREIKQSNYINTQIALVLAGHV